MNWAYDGEKVFVFYRGQWVLGTVLCAAGHHARVGCEKPKMDAWFSTDDLYATSCAIFCLHCKRKASEHVEPDMRCLFDSKSTFEVGEVVANG